jgi:hypothetical protein
VFLTVTNEILKIVIELATYSDGILDEEHDGDKENGNFGGVAEL